MSTSSPPSHGPRRPTPLVWLLIILLIVGVSLPSLLLWSDEQSETHARWETEVNLAQIFQIYGMQQAARYIATPGLPSNNTAQDATETALGTAVSTLNELMMQDTAHFSQLSPMYVRLIGLYDNWTYTLALNDSQRTTLSAIYKSVGEKVVDAYADFLNQTGSPVSTLPPWYSGPSPPDDQLLQQAVALMVNLPGLPPFPN
jgi:hypothetical protein